MHESQTPNLSEVDRQRFFEKRAEDVLARLDDARDAMTRAWRRGDDRAIDHAQRLYRARWALVRQLVASGLEHDDSDPFC